jgi:hypothetical protein
MLPFIKRELALNLANLLQKASFALSPAHRRANNLASAVNLQQYTSLHYQLPFPPRSGFLEMNTTSPMEGIHMRHGMLRTE